MENHFLKKLDVITNHEKRSGIRKDIPEGVEKLYVETPELLLAISRKTQDGRAVVKHEPAANKGACNDAEILQHKGMERELKRQSVKDI